MSDAARRADLPISITDVSIRAFQFPEEYEPVIDLWRRAGDGIHLRRSDEPEEIAKKLERDPDLFLVAELNGEIIGAVVGGFDGRRGLVYHLAVDARFRRLGIATRLMEELESRLRAKGCIRSYMLVAKDNLEARSFYEEQGWKNMDDLYTYGKDIA